jgi:hypothetical protein
MSTRASNPPYEPVASAGERRDLSLVALVAGVFCLAVGLFGIYRGLQTGDSRPLLGWLLGFSYWFSMSIGMLFLIMLFNVFDSGWSVIVRRQLEHAVGAIKWLFIIFLPLVLVVWFYEKNPGIVWSWLNPETVLPGGETVGTDSIFVKKSAYLNPVFFTIRVGVFFAIWIVLAETLRHCSFSLEKDGDPKWVHLAHNVSAIGVVLCALSATFAAIDWFKSIEYHWFSTMYGVWFFAESMRAALAGTVIVCMLLASKGYLKGIYNRCHSYLLGCLMLAFTVFWAYISFSQYFLIYNANIPEETFWYNIRELNADGSLNSWWWVSMALIFCHFVFPFLYLLWYKNKFGPRILFISVWILVFHGIDLYWNILPGRIPSEDNALGYTVRQFSPTIWDLATWLGIGCICFWAFMVSSRSAKPIPIRDPRILESINAHE